MQQGIITKGIAGFYYVETEDGRIVECKAKGKFRKDNLTPLIGDFISFEYEDEDHGFIVEIHKRSSELVRPAVANVNHAIIVFAVKKPDINLFLLDKLLVSVESKGIDITLCLNKSDLDEEHRTENLRDVYTRAGYQVIITNGKSGKGVETLRSRMKDKISVFMGPSGVGKSTMFNRLQDKKVMDTGEISQKAERGKHTTRHAELIKIDKDTYLVDTPGFTSFDIKEIQPEELQYLYPEFREFIGLCKFSTCVHYKENQCKVKDEVGVSISEERYESYAAMLKAALEESRRYKK